MLVHIVQRRQFCGIPFTFISGLYNYYQPSDVLSVVRCVEILYGEYYGCYFQNFHWLTILKSKINNNVPYDVY
jgi:hypothetical protein